MTGTADAEGEGVIRNYVATVTVNADGSLAVTEVMEYDQGGLGRLPGQRVERTLVTREQYDADDDRIYDVSEVRAQVDGETVDADVDATENGVRLAMTIPPGSPRVRWDYTITGAVAETADGIEVRWPVVQGFDRPIAGVTVDWNAPDVLWLSCLTGAPGSSRPCTTSQLAEGPTPTMSQRGVVKGGEVVGILGLSADSGVSPDAKLETRWSLSHAFTSTGTALFVALFLLAVGLLAAFLLWWTRGRDVSASVEPFDMPIRDGGDGQWVFAPPSAIRPGQMGTLVDERADVVDVAATVVDLATRNYLFIEEIARGPFGRMDWMLRRRNAAGDELLGYERTVFESTFATSDEVLVSALPDVLRDKLGSVQSLMYADMVDQGWFAERPDAVRGRWTTAGWALVASGVVLTVVLALVSSFGLVGLAVVIGGAALASAGQIAPARTAKGSQVLRQLRELRDWIETADVGDLPRNQREQLLSRLYPYALVFGSGDRWAQAIADLDEDPDPDAPLYWYGAPADWHLGDIAPSLHNLTVSLNAALGSRRLLD
jgi:hypothetical protein